MRIFATSDRAAAPSREWHDLPLLTSTRPSKRPVLTAAFLWGGFAGFLLGLLVR